MTLFCHVLPPFVRIADPLIIFLNIQRLFKRPHSLPQTMEMYQKDGHVLFSTMIFGIFRDILRKRKHVLYEHIKHVRAIKAIYFGDTRDTLHQAGV